LAHFLRRGDCSPLAHAKSSVRYRRSWNALNPTITCNDNGSFQVTLTATDDDGGSGTSNANVALINVAPVLGAITAPVNPVDVATAVAVSAPFTDQGKHDTHTGSIDWGDGSTPAAITETPGSGSGTAAGSHIYSGPGVYTIKMTVTDDDGGVSNQSIFQYVVIYDPSAGFVTGGGYIMSPVGAYVPDPTLVGKANFGFVAKYQKGKTIPDGDTEFQFHAASVNFKSTSYQWLVVQGTTKASYKGEGTINGTGTYGFMLSVVDGGSTGDKFRIKIWNKATSVVVYDNQMGGADDATASQGIASGSIVIHTNGGVASK
jgi:PKD repeat protein